jgi:tRNA pseudouridine55 synthase
MSEISKKLKVSIENLRFFNENLTLTKELVEEGLVFLIDKPLHWTSFDVVNKLKYALRHKFKIKKLKIGHAGTLDPLATGLIIVCCGKYTKIIDFLLNERKSYSASVKLGVTTASYDGESQEENPKNVNHLHENDILKALSSFHGEIMQTPPIFSAIKIKGKNAYDLARKGKDFELKPRPVHIYSLIFCNYSKPVLKVTTEVSKGTYIRSLANDIGKALEVGGYLIELRREGIGVWDVSQSFQLERILSFIGD